MAEFGTLTPEPEPSGVPDLPNSTPLPDDVLAQLAQGSDRATVFRVGSLVYAGDFTPNADLWNAMRSLLDALNQRGLNTSALVSTLNATNAHEDTVDMPPNVTLLTDASAIFLRPNRGFPFGIFPFHFWVVTSDGMAHIVLAHDVASSVKTRNFGLPGFLTSEARVSLHEMLHGMFWKTSCGPSSINPFSTEEEAAVEALADAVSSTMQYIATPLPFIKQQAQDYLATVELHGAKGCTSLLGIETLLGPTIEEFSVPTAGAYPHQVTAGPDGNLWFTEHVANRIGRITPAGAIAEFDVRTPLSYPLAITAGPDGNTWFVQGGAGAGVGRVTPSGAITEFLSGAGVSPYGITTGADGNLWFSLYGAYIARMTPGGTITAAFAVPTYRAAVRAITAGPDGNIWFAEYYADKIGRITPAGAITEFPLPTGANPQFGITAGPDGNIWFTEEGANKIGRITPTGTVTEFDVPTPSSRPMGITAGPDGNIWFTEFGGGKVGRITPTGTITDFAVPTPFSGPLGIAAGPDGRIWFTEYDGNQIGRITP